MLLTKPFPNCFLCFVLTLAMPGIAQPSCLAQGSKGEHYKNEKAAVVYQLPYVAGKAKLMIQGWNSSFSHKGEYANDFKMKKGTAVCAARAGTVIALRTDSDRGGLKPAMLSEGNYVIIRHSDSTEARYWHLKKAEPVINIGDTVIAGQLIGYSGNTGYSAFPHLHFEIADEKGNLRPVLFHTRKGARYLRPGRWYRAVPASE